MHYLQYFFYQLITIPLYKRVSKYFSENSSVGNAEEINLMAFLCTTYDSYLFLLIINFVLKCYKSLIFSLDIIHEWMNERMSEWEREKFLLWLSHICERRNRIQKRMNSELNLNLTMQRAKKKKRKQKSQWKTFHCAALLSTPSSGKLYAI